MLEYKRERNLLENRVEQLDKKATYHDDHIRVMDAWWDQVYSLSPSSEGILQALTEERAILEVA